MTEEKVWYKSKGKIGGICVAVAGILSAIGLFLQGQLDAGTLVNQVIPLIAGGLALFGIRSAQG